MRTWLVAALLLAVLASPMLNQTSLLEESGDNLRYSSPIQAMISLVLAGPMVAKKSRLLEAVFLTSPSPT